MLPLWKDKSLHLTLVAGQCHWLLHERQSGSWACASDQLYWEKGLIEQLKGQQAAFNSLFITFASEQCRFAILPAQQVWPEPEVLHYLAIQCLKQNYPNYDAGQFVLLTADLQFNQPCLIVAIPQVLHIGLQLLKQTFRVKEALPTLIKAWNFYAPHLYQQELRFIEYKFYFELKAQQCGALSHLHVLPSYLIDDQVLRSGFNMDQPPLRLSIIIVQYTNFIPLMLLQQLM